MKVYHITSRESVAAIEAHGFHDDTVPHLSALLRRAGVWVADVPLVLLSPLLDIACFEIEVAEAVLAGNECRQEGRNYREFLVPAAALNGCRARLLPDGELYSMPWAR